VQASGEDRLDSWKEIAAYLKRAVRTVRRWERSEGLPVHRHAHQVLGSVYAYKSEIDAWRQTARRRSVTASQPDAAHRHVKSIVVLPFANLSTDPENEYFADGLTDEVTADLARVGALRVISRTSAMTFKRTAKDAGTIARELRVQYILEGTVRRAGNHLRITAQLIEGASDAHVWAEKFESPVDDIFAIQERIARLIVEALELRLTTDEERRLSDRPIGSVHAYECYLRARQEAWRWRRDAIDHAIQLLHNGLAIVGDNARLYAALGHAYLQYREAGIDLGQRPLDEAEACARKVFALEPESSSGIQLRGWIHYGRGRIQDAVRDLKAALRVDGNNADTLLLLVNCYMISGKVANARPLIERVLTIDPLTPLTRCLPAFADAMEGNFAAAIEPYRQMCEMDPGNPMARLFYVWVLVLNRLADAASAVANAFPLDVRDTLPARIAGFLADVLAGKDTQAGEAVAKEIEKQAAAPDLFPRMLAQGYALAGKSDPALRWLAMAIDRGFINYPFLMEHDPFFTRFRSLERFQQLMIIVRDRWEAFEA
jgi:TolB-like protein/thioredoxin-like negative regulator of GroEL